MDIARIAGRIIADIERCETCGAVDCPAADGQGRCKTIDSMPPGRRIIRNPRGVPSVSHWPAWFPRIAPSMTAGGLNPPR